MNSKIILCVLKNNAIGILLELYHIYKLNKELTSLQYQVSTRKHGSHFHLLKFAFMFLSDAVKYVSHRQTPLSSC